MNAQFIGTIELTNSVPAGDEKVQVKMNPDDVPVQNTVNTVLTGEPAPAGPHTYHLPMELNGESDIPVHT